MNQGSETSLTLVRQYYAHFNDRNWEGMLACLHPEVQHDANQGVTYRGLDHFREFLRHMDECYEETLTDQVFMADETGNRIASEFTVNGIYKKTDGDLPPATGQRYVLPAGAFLEVQDGRIIRVTTYYNLPLWLLLIEGDTSEVGRRNAQL
jgi:steroid delta-isomerase-like uncharacterized protein